MTKREQSEIVAENRFFSSESILSEYSDTLGTGNFLDLEEDNDKTKIMTGILGLTIFLFAFIAIALFYFVQQNISDRALAANALEDPIEIIKPATVMPKHTAPITFDSLAMNE